MARKCIISTVFFLVFAFCQEGVGADVPQWAIDRAVEFADLDTVYFATQERENAPHTEYYVIRGASIVDGTPRKKLVAIESDSLTQEPVRLALGCPRYDTYEEEVVIQPSQVLGITEDFLTAHSLTIPPGFELEQTAKDTVFAPHRFGLEYYYQVRYLHFIDGVPVRPDQILFHVGATYGDVILYYEANHQDIPVSTIPGITSDSAIVLARNYLSTIGFDPGMDVSAADLEIGNPNDYFEEWSWQWVDGWVLTWKVLFMHWMEDWYTPCVEVWVDAHTGEIQGGGLYRNAWDEEFGLHNILYALEGWITPRMECMRYDVHDHGWGYYIPSDGHGQVVNAAEPPTDVFVIVGHGAISNNMNYVSLSPRPSFYPTEVLDNVLRWSYLGTCFSGDSLNLSNCFCDAFTAHGSMLYTGYRGSVAPDPYEDCLFGELAKGEYVENAHLNCKHLPGGNQAVFKWREIPLCYNSIRLAPLFVDVSVEPSFGPPGTQFHISATVENLDGLGANFGPHQTATNLTLRLEYDHAQFTNAGGADEVNKGDLPYTSATTVHWYRQAKSTAPLGEYVFDIEVWSDNLAVAVDEPDTLGCPCVHPVIISVTKQTTAPEEGVNYPNSFYLRQSYPNPFNLSTKIEYGLVHAAHVVLKVYNVQGQLVRTLVDENQNAGDYAIGWDGRDERGQEVTSGLYFYRLNAGEWERTNRMVLLK